MRGYRNLKLLYSNLSCVVLGDLQVIFVIRPLAECGNIACTTVLATCPLVLIAIFIFSLLFIQRGGYVCMSKNICRNISMEGESIVSTVR